MIPITKWAGLVTNASQYAIPPGATVEQVNLQCLAPGQLTARPGMTPVTFANPSTSTTAIVRAFRYQHGSSEHIVYQDASGRIYSSVVAASSVATAAPPSAPLIAAALPGNGSISVTVTPPTATGGASVTGYVFQTSIDGGVTWAAAGSAAAVTHTILGLSNGVAYRVRAAATNASGTGDFSAAFGPVAPRAPTVGPATPPGLVTASADGPNSATVTWYTPTDNGGSAITGYIIQRSANRGLTWEPGAVVGVVSQAALSGLSANTDYVFRVAATTSYGTGQYSSASNAVSIVGSSSTPSQPTNLSGVATTTSVTLSWSAPGSDGGSPVTGYSIRYGTSSSGPWTVQSASGLTGTVTGLTANTRYTFGVYASNANGSGQIASVDVTTLATAVNTVPSAPLNLTLTPTADGFAAAWDAPSINGGSEITAYRLTTAPSSTAQETQVYQNTTRSYTATGLTAGSDVWVYVYAVNEVGASPAMRGNVRVGLAPTAPRNFTATPTTNSVALSWTPPENLYGQPVRSYVLSYGVGYGNTVAGNETSYVMTPIAGQPFVAGESYTYTIAAVTAAGTGTPASVTFTVPSAPAVPPTSPQGYTLTPTDGGFVASWDAPESSGSSPLLGYKTYILSGSTWQLRDTRDATSRNYQATGYTNGVAVRVRTTAYSAAGESTPTEGSVTPFALPSAPRNLAHSIGAPSASGATVSLTWSPPLSLGGLALTEYILYRGSQLVDRPTTTSASIFQPLGTESYTVSARTSAGISVASNAVTVTVVVPTAPAAPTVTVVSSSSGRVQFTATTPLPAGMSSATWAGQFSLDSGATWQVASASDQYASPSGGTPTVSFTCDIPYANSSSRAVLVRARASTQYAGVSYPSDWSSPASATVTFSAPVFSPTITSTELPSSWVRILWTAPTSTGGSPITKYTVTYSGTGITTTTYDAGLQLQRDIPRQTNSTASIVVRAYNAIGNTASATYTLPAVIPSPGWNVVELNGSPTGLQPNSNGTVKMRASHPAGIEWQTIDFYRWQSSADGVSWTTLADTPTTDDDQGRSYTATSQPDGLRYYRSRASIGGVLSSPSFALSKPTIPGTPRSAAMTQPAFSFADGGFASTITWTGALYDGGRPITAYELQTAWTIGFTQPLQWSDTVEHSVATHGSGPYSKVVVFPTLASPTSDGATSGTATYWVRVRAATSRNFSDPLRAGLWQYLSR